MHASIFHQLKILSMDLASLLLSLLHRITLSNLIFLFQFMHNRWFFKRDPYLETYSKSINPKDLSMSVQFPHKLEYFLRLQYPYPFHFKWHEIETLSAFNLSDHWDLWIQNSNLKDLHLYDSLYILILLSSQPQ